MVGKISRFLVFLINVAFSALLLATLFAGNFNPGKAGFVSSLALFFPYLLVVNVFFLVFWLLLWKKYVVLPLLVLLVSIPAVNNSYPLFKTPSDDSGDALELEALSYNTMANFVYKKHTKEKPSEGIRYILDKDADIVCLQEFNVSKSKNFLTHDDVLEIFKKYKYKHISYKIENARFKQVGMATFSKYPIVNKQSIDYPSRYNASIFTDIDIAGTVVRVFNVHLESNKITGMDKAVSQKLKSKFDSDDIAGITNEFSRKLNEAAKVRAKQVDIVSEMIKESPYKVIVCGDFNDVPLSYAYKKMRGNLSDSFVESGKGLGLTYSRGIYQLRIDYILHDEAFIASDFQVDKVDYSDHYPVMCKLKIKR
ncbi:MAG: endonuclease/exonuclease/phosphatase family protein [Prevotellaceae bacterium]|jgi:endonuclease/exonuclease/phosphatase family metal-dependent hydrolase|nr:endonuclease/exonuclease/phosphatase family protein [Prevotellaceae bacterium]